MPDWKLVELVWGSSGIALTVSPWLLAAAALIAAIAILALRWIPRDWFSRYEVVDADVSLGHIGHLKLKPSTADLQIAHRIWTELVTRKAAIPINPEQDLITEVYDSWYTLFGKIRDLIAEIPAERIRHTESTETLVRTATQTLNEGFRPHLTRWQAEFRNWMKQHKAELKEKSPQEVQKGFPNYATLVAELREVNRGLIEYAAALEKIARG